ncbi:hypothetical protein D3C81_1886090 [compost metagenome]
MVPLGQGRSIIAQGETARRLDMGLESFSDTGLLVIPGRRRIGRDQIDRFAVETRRMLAEVEDGRDQHHAVERHA